jgi:flavin-dependent dehydrogenase
MPDSVDVLVIGGGPGGATAGLLLARAGWSVAVVEQEVFPRRKVCGEFLSASNLPLLRLLHLERAFCDLAGPEVRRVAVFAGNSTVSANMPALHADTAGWGRALGREHLDTILLAHAAAAGAAVWQPWSAVALRQHHDGFICNLATKCGTRTHEVSARLIIAAHGSWLAGALPTQPVRRVAKPSDLFGFKAHFYNADLPNDLMPLLAFPGGYGGMVHTDGGRISLSCCIRRNVLVDCRHRFGGTAGDAVRRHITAHCSAAERVLRNATREAAWQSTGPIRPGIRIGHHVSGDGVFLVGNAAGEAHPVVAEGIGMAMQSGWLAADTLIQRPELLKGVGRREAGSVYQKRWRHTFAARIFAASAIAQWAMRPSFVECTLPVLRAVPALMTLAARSTGKVSPICSPSF